MCVWRKKGKIILYMSGSKIKKRIQMPPYTYIVDCVCALSVRLLLVDLSLFFFLFLIFKYYMLSLEFFVWQIKLAFVGVHACVHVRACVRVCAYMCDSVV